MLPAGSRAQAPVVPTGGGPPSQPIERVWLPSAARVSISGPPSIAGPPTQFTSIGTAELSNILRRLEALEQYKAKAAAEKTAAKKAGDKESDGGWEDLSNEKWTVRLGGHVQLDYINWANADPAIVGTQDYFEFRRLRLVEDGTGYGVFDFRLQFTLEPETVGENPLGTIMSPDVKDAYLSMNEVPWLGRWRIGNFFVPFSLEQVTNDTNKIFLERSIPTQGVFAADREVGMAIYNATEDQSISWSFGVFFDSITDSLKERIDDNQGIRLSGRVVWVPYYDEPSNGRYVIHTGVGILHTHDQDERVRFRTRPHIHEDPRLIDSSALDANTYTSGNVELATVWGQFSVQSELFLTSLHLAGRGPTSVYGAYAHLSYFLTGESRTYERFGQQGAQFGRNGL
jgi:phosphate-selective porin OprO/OprP